MDPQTGIDPSNTGENASGLPPEALDLASKLFSYAREGQTEDLHLYISAGIPVNMTNGKGDTLLMLAAYHGQVETVKMLLDLEADENALNGRAQSIIAGAVFKGHDKVVKLLLERGADAKKGQPNAIDVAKMFKREECLKLFGE